MKILVVCSTLDLQYKLGCTPSWWQLLKALHETGNEVIAIPFLGDPVESLWWRCYPNPCSGESRLFYWYLDWKKSRGTHTSGQKNDLKCKRSMVNKFSEGYIRTKWENALCSIFDKEQDIDLLFFMNVPLSFIKSIPEKIKSIYGIPVAYYDGDMPTILPKYAPERGFKFNYYLDADISVFDAFFTNSKGVIPDLKEMGGRNVHPLYYAADPELFKPVITEKNIDVSFFGYGSEFREEWMKKMISEPSCNLPDVNFSVAGKGFGIDLGKATLVGDLSFSEYRHFTCRSRISLNIARWSHASVYASSTARPFELAAFGACIVSQPYDGIEEWFDVGREIIVVKNEKEVLPVYRNLLDSDDEREKMGERARQRILKDHTYRHRAETVINTLKKISSQSTNSARM
jgi:glycosyltransferase involved in cell wall biosynthesis